MAVPAPIRWAQRKDKVLVTVGVIDVRDPVLKIEGGNFTFSGTAGQTAYANNVELYSDIDEAQSKFVVRPRGVEIALAKKDSAIWWPRLVKGASKLHWLTVDWSRWVDSSDDEPSKPDFNWDPGEGDGIGGGAGASSSSSDDEAPADPPGDAPAGDAPAGDAAASSE
jgi:hypothetical protein